MRRKIILGFILHTLVFVAAAVYLASKIHSTTEYVDRVVQLHQVELLREDFLLRLRAVQADLLAESSARPLATPDAENVLRVGAAIEGCFACHHAPEVTARLASLREQSERYRLALATTPPGQDDAAHRSRQAAFAIGERLTGEVREMIDTTQEALTEHTLDALREVARTKWVVIALALFGPLLSALVGLVAVTGVTRPLEALLSATRQLKRGDLDHRVAGLHDEFEELADSFNEMASSLKDQLQLMQRTEQLVVVGELAAGLVHEIKNPLAGIKAAMQVLAREANVSHDDREVLDKVAREVVGLEQLLRAFLDFAKPAKPQLSAVDVNAFVETVAAFYLRSHTMRPERPVRIAKVLGEVPLVRADPMQLQQILLNLLLNAAEAMPSGGKVELRTAFEPRSGEVLVEIADAGRGISPEHARLVFSPFFTTKPGGTGLGLAVSKRLAEHHGGALDFKAGPDGGTVFRLRLPVDGAGGGGVA